jgi:hypothetical protein
MMTRMSAPDSDRQSVVFVTTDDEIIYPPTGTAEAKQTNFDTKTLLSCELGLKKHLGIECIV